MPTVLEEVAAIKQQRKTPPAQPEWCHIRFHAAPRLGLDVGTVEELCRRRGVLRGAFVLKSDLDQLAVALEAERAAARAATATSTPSAPAPAPSRPAALPAVATAATAKPAAPVKTAMQLETERGLNLVANLETLGVIRRPARARRP